MNWACVFLACRSLHECLRIPVSSTFNALHLFLSVISIFPPAVSYLSELKHLELYISITNHQISVAPGDTSLKTDSKKTPR